MLNKANYKMCGSPIVISSSALKINFSELLSLFNQYQRKYGVDEEFVQREFDRMLK